MHTTYKISIIAVLWLIGCFANAQTRIIEWYKNIEDKKTITVLPSSSSILSFYILTDKTFIFHPQTGAEIGTKIGFLNAMDNDMVYEIKFRPRYSFKKRAFQPILSISTYKNSWRTFVSAGRDITDYNEMNTVSFWPNTTSALLAHRNHKSLYDRRFIDINICRETKNDAFLTLSLEYYEAKALKQVSDFSILYPKRRYKLIEPNCHRYLLTDSVNRYKNQANMKFSFSKYDLWEKNISVDVSFKQGLDVTNQSGAFSQVTAEISQIIGGAMNGNFLDVAFFLETNHFFAWSCSLGYMKCYNDNVKFSDWMHQKSADRVFAESNEYGFVGFLTYSPYEMSTNKWFASGDLRLQYPLILTHSTLALLGFTEELYLRHACINGSDNYSEFGYSLVNYGMIRYGVFVSLHNLDYQGVGFRLGVDIK